MAGKRPKTDQNFDLDFSFLFRLLVSERRFHVAPGDKDSIWVKQDREKLKGRDVVTLSLVPACASFAERGAMPTMTEPQAAAWMGETGLRWEVRCCHGCRKPHEFKGFGAMCVTKPYDL